MERVRVIIDTREQEPLFFDPAKIECVSKALKTGDYSLEGFEDQVSVERKSLDDLVSTITRSRKRFARELERMHEHSHACVVVEGNLSDVFERQYQGGAHPSSVLGSVISIIVDHGIPVFFCADRQIACRFIQDYLLRVHKAFEEAGKS
jgi:DNA excision repair protein ERCC-4